MSWGEMDAGQRTAAILPLLSEGLTIRQIVDRLGATSRNSVLGYVHRYKQKNPQEHAVIAEQTRLAKQCEVARTKRQHAIEKRNKPGAKPTRPSPDRRPPVDLKVSDVRRDVWAALPGAEPKLLHENRGCWWPVSDPFAEGPSLFCGCSVSENASFCATHKAIAYTKAPLIAASKKRAA